jgi:hypothetical protein
MVVKRVGPLSVAKNAAVLYAIFGVIAGAFVSLFAMAGSFASDSGAGAGIMGMLGVGSIVVFPIMYACMGFIGALIAAALYNVVSGMVGGIELDVE